MLDVRVRLPREQLVRALRLVDPKAVNFAEVEALNGTATAVQKVGLRAVSQEMGIPVTALKKRGRSVSVRSSGGKMGAMPISRARRYRLQAVVHGYGRPFNLSRFNAQVIRAGAATSVRTGKRMRRKQRGKVLGVMHTAWGRSQFAPGLFRLRGNSGPVMKRVSKNWKAKRGAIDGAYGPGLTHVMQYAHIERTMRRAAVREFPRRFVNRLQYAFSAQFHL